MPSSKVLQQKQDLVKQLTERLQNSCCGILVNYKGINVEDDTKLRKELREAGVKYSVVKNTMLQRAAKAAKLDDLETHLKDTTALATSETNYTDAAKILCKFASDNKFFQIKSGFVDAAVVDEKQILALSKMPSKEELLSMLLRSFNAPITGFARVLSGMQRGLVVALNAIAEKKVS